MFVSTSAIDCLERLISEMTYCVLSGMLNPIHSLIDECVIGICFANVDFFKSILSIPLNGSSYATLTNDVYRSAVEHYEVIFGVLTPKKFGAQKLPIFDDSATQWQL